MKILWTGAAPWCNSGYGKPLRYLIPLLHAAGHESAIACYSGFTGTVANMQTGGAPVRLYPPFKTPYFNDSIELHAADWQAEVVISLQDVWLLDNWAARGIRWLPWLPIDCNRITEPVTKALQGCEMPLSMSQHGQRLLTEAGWSDARHIPMGVDLDIYRPRPNTRAGCGLPEGVFIAGMVAANSSFPSRKSIPEVLLAWKQWLEQGNQGLLYIHTLLQPKYHERRGLFLPTLLNSLGLEWATLDDPAGIAGASVLFPSQYRQWCGDYSDAQLADLYNCFDVLLSPSQAEGFGIPILEAQACGVPVVTLNTTAMPEITFSGRCLEPLQQTWELQGGWRGVAGVDALVAALDWAADVLLSKAGKAHYGERARGGAEDLGWQRIVDTAWLPLLEEICLQSE